MLHVIPHSHSFISTFSRTSCFSYSLITRSIMATEISPEQCVHIFFVTVSVGHSDGPLRVLCFEKRLVPWPKTRLYRSTFGLGFGINWGCSCLLMEGDCPPNSLHGIIGSHFGVDLAGDQLECLIWWK